MPIWSAVACVSVALIVYGVLLLRSTVYCTPEVSSSSVCRYNPLGPWGSWIALFGVCLLIYSAASIAKSWGTWRAAVPELAVTRRLSPAEAAAAGRAERQTRGILIGVVALVLVAVEAFPLYTLYVQTTAPPQPTFDPVAFVAVLAVAGVADLIVLFLVYVYLANR